MIPYNEFQLTEKEIDVIKSRNMRSGVRKYIKKHGVEPKNACQFYTATEEELEKARKAFYAIYLDKEKSCGSNGSGSHHGNNGNTNNTGGTIDTGHTNIDTGQTEDTGSTNGHHFVITTTGVTYDTSTEGNSWLSNAVNVFREAIISGELLDLTTAEITLTNGNGDTISITDLTKSYSIPDGTYSISGWVGRQTSTNLSGAHVNYWHDWGWPVYEKPWYEVVPLTIDVTGENKEIVISLKLKDALVVSDEPFSINTLGSNTSAHEFNGIYYMFTRNEYHAKGASWTAVVRTAVPMNLFFDSITYTINSFDMGKIYYYGGIGV